MEIDRRADLLSEALEGKDRFDRELDVGVVRELVTHAARVATRRSGPEHRLPLDQDHIGQSAAGQMVRHAGPHTPAADDHCFRRLFHRPRDSGIATRDSGFGIRQCWLWLFTFSTASMTRRMLPPRIFSTSPSE